MENSEKYYYIGYSGKAAPKLEVVKVSEEDDDNTRTVNSVGDFDRPELKVSENADSANINDSNVNQTYQTLYKPEGSKDLTV